VKVSGKGSNVAMVLLFSASGCYEIGDERKYRAQKYTCGYGEIEYTARDRQFEITGEYSDQGDAIESQRDPDQQETEHQHD
jgi:hypothetical protein